jgi:histidine triad (HIT) family protein
MDCIFCKIVRGEMPSYKVYEDELFLGFLDIFPLSKGNVLLIPKHHHRWVNDVPEFGLYWEAAKKISQSIEKNLAATSISYFTFGEEVPHAHIRIIPRYSSDDTYFTLHEPKKYSPEEMKKIQEQIKNLS